jgi:hypothetical protein
MSEGDPPRKPRGRLEHRLPTGLPVGRWLAFSIGALLILAVIGIGLAFAANARVTDRRALGNRIAPAQVDALDLENALINEETGVRGFIITHQSGLSPAPDPPAWERRGLGSRCQERALARRSMARHIRDAGAPRDPLVDRVRIAWEDVVQRGPQVAGSTHELIGRAA